MTFEGIDGSGKSSLSEAVEVAIASVIGGERVVRTHEPGGWNGGGALRSLILSGSSENTWTELLLFLADRCEHVHRVIGPSILSGKVILCERFTDSTLAYQSFGRGFPRDIIETFSQRAGFPIPDITFWIDLPVETALKRICERGEKPDRFEKDPGLLERISCGYRQIHESEPKRVIRIDGTLSPGVISSEVTSVILKRL
ncbi:MAG TPA: dTMP kinase [Synergistales bacterium]|nr:dTMP kinase [Synergistales bacterium]HRV70582.1 dTMP kinase [Thermovirgaceae bacterium]